METRIGYEEERNQGAEIVGESFFLRGVRLETERRSFVRTLRGIHTQQ